MALSKEDLLKPRIKIIAGWPLMEEMDLEVGKVYAGDDLGEDGMQYLLDYPHLFQKLEWWQEREESELPEYVKNKETGIIFRIAPQDQDGRIWHNDDEIENRHFKRWANSFDPSNIDEFNTQKSKQ